VETSAAPGESIASGRVSAPVPTFKPEPEYSEKARKAKWQGSVRLSLIVDAEGFAIRMTTEQMLGYGLDAKAMEAVKAWRFKPGIKDGKAVPIKANIEVNFRLL
jgi:periplasmic protein TonB